MVEGERSTSGLVALIPVNGVLNETSWALIVIEGIDVDGDDVVLERCQGGDGQITGGEIWWSHVCWGFSNDLDVSILELGHLGDDNISRGGKTEICVGPAVTVREPIQAIAERTTYVWDPI